MKLSTKGRYGSRAMLDLALNYKENDGPVALNSIAERQEISEEYLEQIFSSLRKSGLVESVRGAQGGYKLGRSADKISIGDILRSLEGSLAPVDCVIEGRPADCKRYEDCIMKNVWTKVRDSINDTVDGITLSDLVAEFQALNGTRDVMYFI